MNTRPLLTAGPCCTILSTTYGTVDPCNRIQCRTSREKISSVPDPMPMTFGDNLTLSPIIRRIVLLTAHPMFRQNMVVHGLISSKPLRLLYGVHRNDRENFQTPKLGIRGEMMKDLSCRTAHLVFHNSGHSPEALIPEAPILRQA
jgi:hypothetical protein